MATTVTLKPNAIDISGSTSGTTTLQATAVAGTTTITLPAATDTLVGKATTDTLTNKTLTGAVMNGTLGATTPSTVAATTISASSTATFAAGAVGTPSITTTGDTNTGIFFPAADTIAFSEGGAESMRIDSSGNVGIGTTSPSEKLEVAGNAKLTGTNLSIVPSTATSAAYTLNTNTGGNFFLGIDSSTGASFTGTAYGRFLYSGGAYPIVFLTNDTERMRIDSSGNLLVGTTSQFSSGKICVSYDGTVNNGMVLKTTNATLNSNFLGFYNSAGNNCGVVSQSGTTTVAYTTSSDYRLKENIMPMTGALASVAQLKPVTYKWKVDGSDGQGFIAHELQEVVPNAVVGSKDAIDINGNPKYQGIDTSFLVATLTAALQETKALIDTQAETINALTARIVALESK